jgi:hypothetical protein
VEMVVAGLLIVLGIRLRASGLFSTIGFTSVPIVAAVQGQPAAFVWMGVAIVVVLVVRRVEGVRDVVRSGISWPRALLYRAVFDASTNPWANGREGSPVATPTPFSDPPMPLGESRQT